MLDLLPPLGPRGDDLTVAQKQLEIAKALALKPKVLILDEPTARSIKNQPICCLIVCARSPGPALVIHITQLSGRARLQTEVTVRADGCVRASPASGRSAMLTL